MVGHWYSRNISCSSPWLCRWLRSLLATGEEPECREKYWISKVAHVAHGRALSMCALRCNGLRRRCASLASHSQTAECLCGFPHNWRLLSLLWAQAGADGAMRVVHVPLARALRAWAAVLALGHEHRQHVHSYRSPVVADDDDDVEDPACPFCGLTVCRCCMRCRQWPCRCVAPAAALQDLPDAALAVRVAVISAERAPLQLARALSRDPSSGPASSALLACALAVRLRGAGSPVDPAVVTTAAALHVARGNVVVARLWSAERARPMPAPSSWQRLPLVRRASADLATAADALSADLPGDAPHGVLRRRSSCFSVGSPRGSWRVYKRAASDFAVSEPLPVPRPALLRGGGGSSVGAYDGPDVASAGQTAPSSSWRVRRRAASDFAVSEPLPVLRPALLRGGGGSSASAYDGPDVASAGLPPGASPPDEAASSACACDCSIVADVAVASAPSASVASGAPSSDAGASEDGDADEVDLDSAFARSASRLARAQARRAVRARPRWNAAELARDVERQQDYLRVLGGDAGIAHASDVSAVAFDLDGLAAEVDRDLAGGEEVLQLLRESERSASPCHASSSDSDDVVTMPARKKPRSALCIDDLPVVHYLDHYLADIEARLQLVDVRLASRLSVGDFFVGESSDRRLLLRVVHVTSAGELGQPGYAIAWALFGRAMLPRASSDEAALVVQHRCEDAFHGGRAVLQPVVCVHLQHVRTLWRGDGVAPQSASELDQHQRARADALTASALSTVSFRVPLHECDLSRDSAVYALGLCTGEAFSVDPAAFPRCQLLLRECSPWRVPYLLALLQSVHGESGVSADRPTDELLTYLERTLECFSGRSDAPQFMHSGGWSGAFALLRCALRQRRAAARGLSLPPCSASALRSYAVGGLAESSVS